MRAEVTFLWILCAFATLIIIVSLTTAIYYLWNLRAVVKATQCTTKPPPPCFRIHAFISISPARTYIRCNVHLIARPIRAPRVNQLRWRMLKLPYTLTAHRLQTGWSSLQPSGSLDSHEQAAIIAVIKRNEQLETAEQQRVGRLVERLENNKLRAAECGPRFCRCVCVLRCNVRTKQARA